MRRAADEGVALVVSPRFTSQADLFAWLGARWPLRIYRIGRQWLALLRVEESEA